MRTSILFLILSTPAFAWGTSWGETEGFSLGLNSGAHDDLTMPLQQILSVCTTTDQHAPCMEAICRGVEDGLVEQNAQPTDINWTTAFAFCDGWNVGWGESEG